MNFIDIDQKVNNIINDNDSGIHYQFNSTWILWFHRENRNWKINGYNKLYSISNIKEFWDLHNNIKLFGGITSHHYFLMKNNIEPTWEHPDNRNGGTWSFKIPAEDSYKLWEKLAMYIVGDTLVEDSSKINGLSIVLKNPSISIIKIWTSDANYSSLNLLPKDIIDEYGYNIIYKLNKPEYN
jgi:translation initiation factor 4E